MVIKVPLEGSKEGELENQKLGGRKRIMKKVISLLKSEQLRWQCWDLIGRCTREERQKKLPGRQQHEGPLRNEKEQVSPKREL